MNKSLSELLQDLTSEPSMSKEAAAAPAPAQADVSPVDQIYELLKTASSSEEEFSMNCAAGGAIAGRAFMDELMKIAEELPAAVVANLPPETPISSKDLAIAAHVISATAANMSEQNVEKDEQAMRLTNAAASGDKGEVAVLIEELKKSNDPEKQKLGLALASLAGKK